MICVDDVICEHVVVTLRKRVEMKTEMTTSDKTELRQDKTNSILNSFIPQ